jgi:hypothetical protein
LVDESGNPAGRLIDSRGHAFCLIIWAVCFWGAFRSLTGSSKLRSFFAFMIWATLFIPLFWLIIPARLLGPG